MTDVVVMTKGMSNREFLNQMSEVRVKMVEGYLALFSEMYRRLSDSEELMDVMRNKLEECGDDDLINELKKIISTY